ncbi:hypothetical protein [Bradyrhizobium genosp. P]|uniref:hypothetical protein n=1 Tax=Bradyrhizobium genosp. P TaxID=83641 RepID=UPI003CF24E2F
MPIDRMMRGLAAAILLASMATLSGCASTVADLPGVADTPARKEPTGYLPVHDLPPDRSEQAMKPADQAKLEAELKAARDRQETAAAQNGSGK